MGIHVGAKVIRNKELLKTIQSRHLGGIYSTADFLSKISEGEIFFFTRYPDSSYLLKKTTPYLGESAELKGHYTYHAIEQENHLTPKREGFIEDFFFCGDAIFTSKDDMIMYQTDLMQNREKLDWEDI